MIDIVMDDDERLKWMADVIAQRQRQQQIDELRKLNGSQPSSNQSSTEMTGWDYFWCTLITVIVIIMLLGAASA